MPRLAFEHVVLEAFCFANHYWLSDIAWIPFGFKSRPKHGRMFKNLVPANQRQLENLVKREMFLYYYASFLSVIGITKQFSCDEIWSEFEYQCTHSSTMAPLALGIFSWFNEDESCSDSHNFENALYQSLECSTLDALTVLFVHRAPLTQFAPYLSPALSAFKFWEANIEELVKSYHTESPEALEALYRKHVDL